MSLETLADHAFAPVALALEDGRIPGAALGIATADGQRALRWGGVATTLPKPEALQRDTSFDLASLTKVIVTVTEILRLVEEGVLDLDDPLAKHLPDAAPLHGAIPLRRLIDHSSGLPAQERIYLWPGPADQRRTAVIRKHWPVKTEPVYSDINYMLLGFVVERWRGVAFGQLPVGTGLSFAPVPAQSAATEVCAVRNRLLRGEVHDENACALGAPAGHAGLFGTLAAVLRFAAGMLDGTTFSPSGLARIRQPVSPTRTLGFELRHDGWAGGDRASPGSIGHTGFTGTGLWVDFERGVAWTLLTNRVHPSRDRRSDIAQLRREVGDRITSGVRSEMVSRE